MPRDHRNSWDNYNRRVAERMRAHLLDVPSVPDEEPANVIPEVFGVWTADEAETESGEARGSAPGHQL